MLTVLTKVLWLVEDDLQWKTTFGGKNVHIRTTSHSYKNHLLCVQKRTHFAAHSALRHFLIMSLFFEVVFTFCACLYFCSHLHLSVVIYLHGLIHFGASIHLLKSSSF